MNGNSAERILDAMQYVDEQILLDAIKSDAQDHRQVAQDGIKSAQKHRRTAAYLSLAATLAAVLIAIPLIFKGLSVTEPPQSPPPQSNYPSFGSSAGTDAEPNEPTSPTETKAPESADRPSEPGEPSQNESESETETETEANSTLTEPTEVTK